MNWIRENIGVFTGAVAVVSAILSWWTTRRIQAVKQAQASALSDAKHAEADAEAARKLQEAAIAAEKARRDAEELARKADAKRRASDLIAGNPMDLAKSMVGKDGSK